MSDVGVLSQEFRTASELARELTRNLIIVKKVDEGLPGANAISPQTALDARRRLAGIAGSVGGRLDSPKASESIDGAPPIPSALVARLREDRRGDLPYYLADLRRVKHRLLQNVTLERDDFSLLDQMAEAAELEASSIFRRLMRR